MDIFMLNNFNYNENNEMNVYRDILEIGKPTNRSGYTGPGNRKPLALIRPCTNDKCHWRANIVLIISYN